MTQLERLAKPFPPRLIHDNPSGGGSYVKHSVVNEKLLAVLGPFNFELVQIVRGHVAAVAPNPQGKSTRAKAGSPALDDCIVGAVCRLSVVVDSVPVSVEEVGDCESPNNWPHDGARLKDAMSDALKRCAMRLGVTLHLWSGAEFSLYEQVRTDKNTNKGAGADSSDRDGDAALDRSDGANSHDVGRTDAEPAPITSTRESNESTTAASGSDSTSPIGSPSQPSQAVASSTPPLDAEPAPSRIGIADLKSRAVALVADSVDVGKLREQWQLPPIDGSDVKQLAMWDQMMADEEAKLTAPFVGAK